MHLLALVGGAALFAIASYLYRWIGQEDGMSAHWRNAPGMDALWVFIILGGWAGGGSLVIKALIFFFFG
jgi:hypothetical protein